MAHLEDGDAPGALEACSGIVQARAEAECVWSVTAQLAATDPVAAGAACETLDGAHASECNFTVAEGANEISLCANAAELETKCRLHFYRDDLSTWVPNGARVADISEQASSKMSTHGLSPTTEAAWFRTYRYVLAHTAPDTSAQECESLAEIPGKACVRALAVSSDRPEAHKPQ